MNTFKENNYKSEKDIYFMLKIDKNGGYIQPVTKEGKVIDSFQFYHIENEHIKKVVSLLSEVQEDDFSIDWEKNSTSQVYLDYFYGLTENLKEIENFITEDFQKIVWSLSDNELTLKLDEVEGEPDKLSTTILLNKKYTDFEVISEGLIYRKGIIYCFDLIDEDIEMLTEKIGIINKNELEVFLTLARHYLKNISFDYMGYSTEIQKDIEGVPQITIEKISQDNSLYLKVDLIFSTITQDFIETNDLKEIVVVNNLEKKIYVCTPSGDMDFAVNDVTTSLVKHQKKLGKSSSFFVDDDNLIIINEKVAREFVTKELLQLAGKYKVVGTDKLSKYNIKPVKPKLIGKLNHSIDFLEGELQLEIGKEKFGLLDVLTKLKKDSYIVLADGTNAIINKKYIEKLEKVFKKVDGQKVKISFFDLPIIDELIEDKILKQQVNKGKEFFKGINEIANYKASLPPLKVTLREYQEYGYKWLCYLVDNKLGGCLADDMGLGKTLQAIALITRTHSGKAKKRTLVVMPKSLIYNWESEIQKFSPSLVTGIYYGNARDISVFKNCEVILTTYGTIRNDIEKIKKYKFELIILDESQNIKNTNAQTTKAVMLLKGNNRIALSGTPVENNLGELYSLFRFLNPPMFGTADEFNRYYAGPIHKENDESAIEELRKKIYPFILRRIKKDVLKDLPDKIEKTLYVEMNPDQRNLYEERRMYYYNMIHENIRAKGIGKSHIYILQALNELRQLTSCPESKNSHIVSSKKEVVVENILDAVQNNHKVLVFANYIHSIEAICKELKKNNIKHLSMTGATKDRHVLVDKFQNDNEYKVFVMTLKTGGVGLNLTAADTIFIYDPWWNKTVENQAVDRAYRLGQDRTVFSYKIILKDSIEEKILKLQESKNKLVENLISEEGTSAKVLSEDDIEFLLGK
ncbi:DEAD/DEAH box helicase [Fusobacterium sp.]|uniref:DEAD/DEAH box helicase n=1 Tax=Fusobacterium sp. TaxID=68766 RepID=UPI00261B826F|nr:DEAD/DEAH box helicase [Fusobacterium sp.]